MITRVLQSLLMESLSFSPAVAILGPRQSGKTTLAIQIGQQIPALYLDLENNLDAIKVADFSNFYAANKGKLLILDEVQRAPQLFSQLRGVIDSERRLGKTAGLFLFLGSASNQLLQQSGESLAGRITYLELHGINAIEYNSSPNEGINSLWVRGGFPESLLAKTDRQSMLWRRSFIRTYLERDIPQLGPRIPAQTLQRFWTMLAHHQGSVINASELARNLEVSSVTIQRYLDLMVDLMLVTRLQPWTVNAGKRLVKSPKVYVRDSGLSHSLLNIQNYNELLSHPIVGRSWEGFVIENILSVLEGKALPYFYRTSAGAEIDLILEFSGQEKWAIEVKRNSTPTLTKGFHQACEDLKINKKWVIYAGDHRFQTANNTTAISLIEFMNELRLI